MKKIVLSFLMLFCLLRFTKAQIINIPDPNFFQALLNLGVDTNNSNDIDSSEAATFVGLMTLTSQNIDSMNGIEAFINVPVIYCENNNLDMLDLSNNGELTFLRCSQNNLTSLDLTANVKLTRVDCDVNNLTNLDVSNCVDLTFLNCFSNNLTSLDISGNPSLSTLACGANPFIKLDISGSSISTLDIANTPTLRHLNCSNNQLSILSISGHPALDTLYCDNNTISSSLGLSSNTALKLLSCSANQLDTINLSANANVTFIDCSDNQLTSLDIKNGNNGSITFFNAINNTSLTCVKVDNVSDANSNWSSNVDAGVTFSTDCLTSVIEENKTTSNVSITLYPNPVKEMIYVSFPNQFNAIRIEILDISGKPVLRQNWNSNQVNVGSLSSGMYFLQAYSASNKVANSVFTKE